MLRLNFSRPLLMGILNVTPDSFSDGGKFTSSKEALEHVNQFIEDGADIIDIGAESTFGPESQITAEKEWKRLEPILTQIKYDEVFVSLDTYKSEVAENALKLGVQMINDVTALRGDDQMMDVLVKYQPYVCLMYSADETPYASRKNHQYDDVIQTLSDFLSKQSHLLLDRGFPKEKIILDPGLGFFLSSDPAVSWEVIDRLEEMKSLGFQILIGPSMKSFLGGNIEERGEKTLEASRKCLKNGADILRIHDVKSHLELL